MARVAPVLLFLLTFAGSACSDNGYDAPAPSETTPPYTYERAINPGPYPVGSTSLDLVDTSRPTMANGDVPASGERSLPTEVWYPAAAASRDAQPATDGGPYPLIVWAHGFSSLPQLTASLLSHLASHGYVVAAPAFPLTRLRAPGGTTFTDTWNQDEDISFVIDEMVSLDDTLPLSRAIDGDRVGLAGHSGGSFTTLLSLYGDDNDERIDAAIAISASACFLEPSSFERSDAPVMFIVGTADRLFSIDGLRYAFDNEEPPRYWVNIRDGNHIRSTGVDLDDAAVEGLASTIRGVAESTRGPSDSNLLAGCAENTPPTEDPAISLDRQQELLRAFMTPFLAAHLSDDDAATRFLEDSIGAAVGDAVDYEVDGE